VQEQAHPVGEGEPLRNKMVSRISAMIVIAFAAATTPVISLVATSGGGATVAAGCDTHKCYY
jgi:hypothetical protein